MSLKGRLAAIEAQLEVDDETPRHFVVTIGDPEPEDMREQDTVIYLPRKYATPELWAEAMRTEFGYLMDAAADDNLDKEGGPGCSTHDSRD